MFTRLSIPTPFQIGPVNAYLAGRTLVDPGPGSEEAWSALCAELESHGMTPSDVERVLITHPHPDHFGLSARFREQGAEVLAAAGAAGIVRDFEGRLAYEQEFFVDFFDRNGMARTTAESVADLPSAFLSLSPSVETDRQLRDGDAVEVEGTELTVKAVQGHSPGELLFTFEAGGERRALVGDHVLNEITPNPLLQPPVEGGDGERPRVLPAYNRSLADLREADLDRLLPGHRDLVTDPGKRIGEILDANEDRTANVLDLVDGPTTAVEVMEGLFGDLPATEYFPAMSEAIGHLDVLEERGEVERSEKGGVIVYGAA